MMSFKPLRAAFTVLFFGYLMWSYLFFFMVGKFFYWKGRDRRQAPR